MAVIPAGPDYTDGQVLTAAHLETDYAAIRTAANNGFCAKAETGTISAAHTFTAAPVLNVAGTCLSVTEGTIVTAATTTTRAGFRLPHGTAPSAPTNGDLWTTTGGLFAYINGATLTAVSGSGTSGKVARWTGTGTLGDGSLEDSGTYVSHAAQPRCFLDATTVTSVTAANTVSFAWSDADIIDVGAMHDPSSNNTRITIPASAGGLYMVVGQTVFGAASTNGQVDINWRKNGTTNLLTQNSTSFANSSETVTIPFCFVAVLAAADYIEQRITNNGSQTISTRTSVAVVRLW